LMRSTRPTTISSYWRCRSRNIARRVSANYWTRWRGKKFRACRS
jgi:hypothetical protein